MPSVVTANLLRSGDVVYLDAQESWVPDIAAALVAQTADELATMEATAQRALEDQKVISIYPMDVDVVNGTPKPLSVREKIRAAHGPTI